MAAQPRITGIRPPVQILAGSFPVRASSGPSAVLGDTRPASRSSGFRFGDAVGMRFWCGANDQVSTLFRGGDVMTRWRRTLAVAVVLPALFGPAPSASEGAPA